MNKSSRIAHRDDVSIVLAGPAGQGIQTMEYLLSRILRIAGYHVFSTSEFMSRIRGGSNSTEIRISSAPVAAYVDKIDIFMPLDEPAVKHCEQRITASTIVLGETALLNTRIPVVDVPFTKTAGEVGGKVYANSVAVGTVCALLNVPANMAVDYVYRHFVAKNRDVADKNAEAFRRGFALGETLIAAGKVEISITKDPSVSKDYFMTGAEAVGLGALTGGCDFVSSYPMSPSTGVLTFLAQCKNEFGMVVEQAEDEIAAMNMALGAWYAGARALVTTSGGGFALMTEGVSLSGMIETPVVVHLGQRPGPATGLPTRTEQADLDLVLYAGHGEFPRVVFAPGTLSQAISVMHRAFAIADKYQIPVFVLTDQFFLDSGSAVAPPDFTQFGITKNVVKTSEDYKRYAFVAGGISPRGVPGNGSGIVCVDSDEHTEEGYITEDLDLRIRMVDKRFKKALIDSADTIPPLLEGPEKFKTLAVCWGSAYHVVREALAQLDRPDLAILHLSQVYPFSPGVKDIVLRAEKVIVVENNATGQLAKALTLAFGPVVHESILKYNGMPFSVEELVDKMRTIA